MKQKELKIYAYVLLISLMLSILLGPQFAKTQGGYGMYFHPLSMLSSILLFMALFGCVIVLFLLGILLIMTVFKRLRRRLWFPLRLCTLFLTVSLIYITLTFAFTSYSNAKSDEVGQEIIDAIETYKADNGKLPDNLSQLVPIYIESIPTSYWNTTFYYKKYGFYEEWAGGKIGYKKIYEENYWLGSYLEGGWYSRVYVSRNGKWYLDD